MRFPLLALTDAMGSPRRIWAPVDPNIAEPVSSIWWAKQNPCIQKMIDDGEMEQLGTGAARFNFALAGGRGTQTTLVLSSALSVHIIDAVLPNPVRAQIVADEPVILLRASLSCEC